MDKTQENEFDLKYPTSQYLKKRFAFSEAELRELASYSGIYNMIKLMENSLNQLTINLITATAKRLNIKDSPAVQLLPTPTELIAYEPKLWCSVCNNQKATNKFEEKVVCLECGTKLEEEAKAKAETKISKKNKPLEK